MFARFLSEFRVQLAEFFILCVLQKAILSDVFWNTKIGHIIYTIL